MHLTCRVIALSVVVTFLAAGPLAPFARAQAPQTSPAPEGDLFQESMKTSQAARSGAPSAGYEAAAVLADVFYVPGKAIVCTTGVLVDIALLALTFGTAYRAAASIARDGCGGKWYLTADDLRTETLARERVWDDRGGF